MTKLPFFFFLLLLPLISGEIKTVKLSYDSRPLILLDRFRFTDTGHITISVSSASAISAVGSLRDLSRFGFFLVSEASSDLVNSEIESNSSICSLDLNYVDRLFTFRDLNHESLNRSYTITDAAEYFLYFQRCASGSAVSMELRTELYNLDARGAKDFLSPDLARWPFLYFGFSVFYFVVLSFLVRVCVRNRNSVHRIHLVMCLLVLAKALSMSTEAEGMRYVKVTGSTPIGWDVLFNVFDFVGDVILFAVIVLLGGGWSFLKQSLETREQDALNFVIALRVLAKVAPAMIVETGPLVDGGWFTWYTFFVAADFFSCVSAVNPVLSSIESLEKTPESEGGKAAAKRLAKLALFRQINKVVSGYLFLTRFMIFVVRLAVPYKYQWVEYAAEEIATLAFCGILVYMFRPVEKNEYFLLDDAEEQVAEMTIQHEEIEV